MIGICNSLSEVVSCNVHFRSLANAVRCGVLHARGLPLEFPTISLGENLMRPTAMLFGRFSSFGNIVATSIASDASVSSGFADASHDLTRPGRI